MKKTAALAMAATLLVFAGCKPEFDEGAERAARDSGGSDVPTLRPDLPDSTSIRFSLRIDLELGEAEADLFHPTPAALIKPETAETTEQQVARWLKNAEDGGVFSPELFVDTDWINDQREFNDAPRSLDKIKPLTAWWQYQQGKRLRLYPLEGDGQSVGLGFEYVPAFAPIVHRPPRLFLLDRYALSSFVGDYGTGRIVNTFSLLPGETTELRVSTYRDEVLTTRSTASILDSTSSESTESFVEHLSDETLFDNVDRSSTTNAEFKAEGNAIPGYARGKASADITKSGNTRRDFHRAVSSSLSQTASRASAARDVYVDTSVEGTVSQGSEDVSIRTVSNINTGHTLNFISYQMNQEYHSVLHLTGVELGYDDGRGNVYVMPLHQMARFLDNFVKEDKQETVRKLLLGELTAITDYKGKRHPDFIRAVVEGPDEDAGQGGEGTKGESGGAAGEEVYAVNSDYDSRYRIPGGGEITVPGIIVELQPVVMRTDGVYVEALVGRNSAWDRYTEQLMAKELRD